MQTEKKRKNNHNTHFLKKGMVQKKKKKKKGEGEKRARQKDNAEIKNKNYIQKATLWVDTVNTVSLLKNMTDFGVEFGIDESVPGIRYTEGMCQESFGSWTFSRIPESLLISGPRQITCKGK